jgi:hypothetical protein
MLLIALFALLCLASLPGDALAGVVRGRLMLNQGISAAVGKVQPGVTEAVIYIEMIPEKVERKLTGHGWFFAPRKPRPPRIVQAGLQFKPRVLVTTTGTSVEFRNLDHVYHNVFSVSAAKRFDLGKYPPGRADTIEFQRSGVVNLHCDIHPDESAFIVVAPNHALARPDSTGRYALPKLPSGTYTLHAWHPRRGEIERSIQIPRRGDLTLDLGF